MMSKQLLINIVIVSVIIVITTICILNNNITFNNNNSNNNIIKSIYHRLLSTNVKHENINSLEKNLKSTNAPIFMQDTESTPPIVLLFNKYGMTGTKKTLKKHPKKKNNNKGSDNNDWATATEYGGKTCGGDKYFVAGVKLDTCIPFLSETPMSGGNEVSFIVNCDDDEGISYYEYYSSDCSDDPVSSKVIAKTGCSVNSNDDNWFTFDDDNYPSSIEISCKASKDTPPYGSGKWDIWSMYSDGGDGKCKSKDFTYFEAYEIDTCIPIQVFSLQSDDESVIFKAPKSDSDAPYIKYYTDNHKCEGQHSIYDLETDCEECGNFLVSTQYSYYDK